MTWSNDVRPMLVDGAWTSSEQTIAVTDPQDGRVLGHVPAADARDALHAVDAAERAAPRLRQLPVEARAATLRTMADRVAADHERFATTIAEEGVKTIREARSEVDRCVRTLRIAAAETSRPRGETQHFEELPGGRRQGYWTREPIGVVSAFTPFNDPLNLVAHKIAPAIAVGAPVIVKPDERTPLSALALAATALDTELPTGAIQVLTGPGERLAEPLVGDPRVRVVSFTGGPVVGARIAQLAAGKTLIAELGNNAAVVVLDDCDLDLAARSIVAGAFAAAGQNCLHVQRVLVAEDSYVPLRERMLEATAEIRVGDKLDPATDMGPLITEQAAVLIQQRIDDALSAGGRLLIGGSRRGTSLQPTLLEEVPRGHDLQREEIFGPVTVLEPITSLADAVREANRGGSHLQAAIFTDSLADAGDAARHLHTGSVVINDSTDFRDDAMPFGSAGGVGREGVRFACESMTAPKLVSIRIPNRE